MIRVTEVTKRYGEHLAVDRVSFAVEAGEVVGFLGPNGAGKSTILRMLATSLAPTSGVVTVAGHDVAREPLAARAVCGYLAEHNPLFESMRVAEWLDFAAAVHGLEGARRKERREFVVDRCGLAEVLARPIKACSKGFRQRIGLAAAILHDPPVLLLDEPTHGLDPLQVVAFRDLVRELRPGRAILLSSHVLAEVAESSDRLLAIQRGRIVLDRTLTDLRASAGNAAGSIEAQVLAAVRAGAVP
ncbi:MAG: ATP-binding cassette domain-containing protein [Planctomycetota bacterium]|nr:ATP-binding cassette domain-containing protein [Planctomycetota bacterium]